MRFGDLTEGGDAGFPLRHLRFHIFYNIFLCKQVWYADDSCTIKQEQTSRTWTALWTNPRKTAKVPAECLQSQESTSPPTLSRSSHRNSRGIVASPHIVEGHGTFV